MKATIFSFLKTVGLKYFVDWWENRGKDKASDLKKEVYDYIDAELAKVGIGQPDDPKVLVSPNKTKYVLCVTDDGVIYTSRTSI